MNTVRPILAALILSVAATAGQQATFQDLFALYRGTEADRAVAAFASWPYSRVEAEAVLTPAQVDDPWAVAALVLFHLETDLTRSLRLQAVSGGSVDGPLRFSGWHVQRAEDVMRRLLLPAAAQRNDVDLFAFARDWLIIRQRAFLGKAFPTPSVEWTDFAPPYYQRDASFQMLMGIEWSFFMGPITQGNTLYGIGGTAEDLKNHGVISFGRALFDAKFARDSERAFKRAVSLDAGLAEARLRLGRYYQVTGRLTEARAELEQTEQVAANRDDRPTRYLSELFLGQLDEDTGSIEAAIDHYRRALDGYSSGLVARLAMGDLLLKEGRQIEAWTGIRSAVGSETSKTLRDPWAVYSTLGYWQDFGNRLAAMRTRVSRTPFGQVSAFVARRLAEPNSTPNPAPPSHSDTPVFRGGVEAIRVDALVTNDDTPIENLTEADFVLRDNGVIQKITRVTVARDLSLGLVLDASASLSSTAGVAYWRQATKAITAALKPADSVAVVSATDRPRLQTDLIHPGAALDAAIAASAPGVDNLTALWDAVLVANGLVANSNGRAAAIIVSDGADTASWISRTLTLKRAPRRGLPLDGVEIPWSDVRGPWFDAAFEEIGLRAPVLATEGALFDVRDPQLPARISQRFEALRNSYILTYTPERALPQKDGWHDIKLSLRSGLKGKVQARPGYYEEKKR